MTTPAAAWTITRRRIPEEIVPGKRLGRHVVRDSRSAAYPYRRREGRELAAVLHTRNIGILDQGPVGSCTGNAETGLLGTDPVYGDLPPGHPVLDEAEALSLYSAAEVIDGSGPYPPNDDGSSGTSVMQAAKNAGLIAGYTHATTLVDMADALQSMPVIIGINWYDCIAPDSRVLTSDLRWTPIQKLSPGDEIIGFDENSSGGRGRKFCRASVVANDLVVKPTITIYYDLGGRRHSLTISEGHLFLVRGSDERQQWRRADRLRLDDEIYSLVAPYEPDGGREAGWIAGFFDGEGSVGLGTHVERNTTRRSYRLDVSQRVGPTLDELKRLLAGRDFDFRVQQARHENHPTWKPLENLWLRGGRPEILRFLGTIRPERLVANGAVFWEGQVISSKSPSRAVITGIRRTGQHELHAIGTSTGTLLVEGLLSHNSFDSLPSSGVITLSPGAYIRGGHEVEVRGDDPAAQQFFADNSWSAGWGLSGSFLIPYAVMERLLAEEGDCTVPVPLTQPPPQPAPPVPGPGPSPPPPADPDLAYGADSRLAAWAAARHVGENRYAADQYTAWRAAKGYSS